MTFLTIFFQMLSLLVMISTGYLITKKGMMDEHSNDQISRMIVDVFNPLLVLSSGAQAVGMSSGEKLASVGLAAVCMFLVFILVGMLLSGFFEKDRQKRKIFQMMFVFSNLGFIGIPVVTNILGPEYAVYVTVFLLVYTIVFYTYGISVMDGYFTLSSLKSMLNPGSILSFAAILMIVLEIRLPSFLQIAVTYLGNVASPLALIAVGFTLAHSDLKKIFGQPRLYVFAFVKLLMLPLLMLPGLMLLLKDADLISVCLVMFGMPVGNMPLMLSNQKGIDGSDCSAAIILTTVLCVFSVPLLLTVFALFSS